MLVQDVDDFIAHGADTILGKPLKISVLSAAIKEHFSEAVKLSENNAQNKVKPTDEPFSDGSRFSSREEAENRLVSIQI
jgi:DNA-binding response OmpR family regulator